MILRYFLLFNLEIWFWACNPKSGEPEEIGEGDNSSVIVPDGDTLYREEYQKAADFTAANKIDKAIAIYEDLLDKDTTTGAASAGLGSCYLMRKEFDHATFYYRKSLTIDSLSRSGLSGMAAAYYYRERYDSSIFYYNRTQALYPDDPYVYLGLTCCHYMKGNKEAVLRNGKKFIELAPNSRDRAMVERLMNE
jgi:tetratricopeptide (TPR) repeat protein